MSLYAQSGKTDMHTKETDTKIEETLRNELKEIEERLGMDLSDPNDRRTLVDEMSRMDQIKEFMR